jgi:hypothetical protein
LADRPAEPHRTYTGLTFDIVKYEIDNLLNSETYKSVIVIYSKPEKEFLVTALKYPDHKDGTYILQYVDGSYTPVSDEVSICYQHNEATSIISFLEFLYEEESHNDKDTPISELNISKKINQSSTYLVTSMYYAKTDYILSLDKPGHTHGGAFRKQRVTKLIFTKTTQAKAKKRSPARRLSPKRFGGATDDNVDSDQSSKLVCKADDLAYDSAKVEEQVRDLLPIYGPDNRPIRIELLCDVRARMSSIPGRNQRLNADQVAELEDLMKRIVGLQPEMTLAYLKACKVVLGRWLRPSEMVALFDADAIYRQRFIVEKLDSADEEVWVGENDEGKYNSRVSYVIGGLGRTLNSVTLRSGTIYIWFNRMGRAGAGKVVANIYTHGRNVADAKRRIAKARAMINGISRKINGFKLADHKRGSRDENMLRFRQVPLKRMYEDMSI